LTPVTNSLLQYGAVGVLALVFCGVALALGHELLAAYKKEVERGDRLEGELRDLNKLINTQYAGELVRATEAIRKAMDNTATANELRRTTDAVQDAVALMRDRGQ
jgi:hypothetical protein